MQMIIRTMGMIGKVRRDLENWIGGFGTGTEHVMLTLHAAGPEALKTYKGKRRDADFWIENPSVEWKESQAPFHTVGRLTLLPRSQLSADESAAMYIDVTENSTPDSMPVGAVNRARWQAELASRKARLGRS
jgi:hypothetical protein